MGVTCKSGVRKADLGRKHLSLARGSGGGFAGCGATAAPEYPRLAYKVMCQSGVDKGVSEKAISRTRGSQAPPSRILRLDGTLESR